MKKSYGLTLNQEEMTVVEQILRSGLFASKEAHGVHERGFYRLNDLSLVSEERLEKMIYELPIFKKSFPLEGELSLELEVGIDPDTALTYIHLSLYVNQDLAAHHVAFHEWEEWITGVSFDLTEREHLFEITPIGEQLLSQTTYHVYLKEKE